MEGLPGTNDKEVKAVAVKRIVDTSFWTDGKVDEFSPEDKYFLLYLLTNPFARQLGIYEISIKQAAFQMGYTVDTFNVMLDRFETKYKMVVFSRETNEIAILNFLRHSIVKGGKPVEDCIRQDMQRVKNRKLIDLVFSRLHGRDDLNVTVKKIVDAYINENGIDNDNDNDNDNDSTGDDSPDESSADSSIEPSPEPPEAPQPDHNKTIVDYLNEKAGTKYKHTTRKTKDCIRARMKEGFTLDDFFRVIEVKCAEWLGTEWEKYLRPETLFGTKFESYLNTKPRKAGGRNAINRTNPGEECTDGRYGTIL